MKSKVIRRLTGIVAVTVFALGMSISAFASSDYDIQSKGMVIFHENNGVADIKFDAIDLENLKADVDLLKQSTGISNVDPYQAGTTYQPGDIVEITNPDGSKEQYQFVGTDPTGDPKTDTSNWNRVITVTESIRQLKEKTANLKLYDITAADGGAGTVILTIKEL